MLLACDFVLKLLEGMVIDMSKMFLWIIGIALLLMALLASLNLGMVVEPWWHIVFKWIAGGVAVLVAFMDKGGKKQYN